MRRSDQVKILRILLPVVAAIPLSWSLSMTWVKELLVSAFNMLTGFTPDGFLLVLFLGELLTLVGLLVVEGIFKLLSLQFLVFVLPTFWGIPLSALKGYTVGGVVFSLALLFGYYIDSPELRDKLFELPPSCILGTLEELLTPTLVGIAFVLLVLYWSELGANPHNALPLWVLLPIIFGASFLVAAGYSFQREEEERLTRLVVRTVMTVGDTFEVNYLSEDSRSVTLALTGGSPVKRPVLMTLDLKWIPAMVILRSPWETKMLTRKYEWVEGGVRYIVYSDTMSRAPSSPDSASAPQ